MRPRRARVHLAIGFGVIVALAVGAFAFYAVRLGTQNIEDQTERDLREQVAYTLGRLDLNNPPTDLYDTWLVDVESGAVVPLGGVDIEPPLYTLAAAAVSSGPYSDRFSQGGYDYLLYAQPLPNSQLALVAASFLGDSQSDVSELRRNVILAAVGVVLFTLLAAYWLAGRFLRPVQRSMHHQRDFLANAAHELRTPIAVIQASASQVLARPRDAEEYVRALSEIRSAAERAGTGVTDLLELARFDTGEMVLRRGPLRLDLLAEEVVATVPPDAAEVTVTPSDAVVVDADYSLLRQALANVVQNATARAEHVEVAVHADGRNAVVEITDDGPGIPDAVLPRVFDRWARGDVQGVEERGGLGLAIVRSIVEAHGGRCAAGNRPEGGAVLRLELPHPSS